MFLRSLTVKNYRSLEDVELDKLHSFNVLIGRNNSGKSSVFGALQLVNSVVKNVGIDGQRVLTDLDVARSLEIRLTFEPRLRDREEFLDLLYATPDLRQRREDEKSSPFMRQVEYLFKAPEGRPEFLQPYEIRVLADDGQWAVVQRVVNPEVGLQATSNVTTLDAIRTQFARYSLNFTVLDIDTAPTVDRSLTTSLQLRTQATGSINSWLWTKLSNYFLKAFFFDPFRHSIESGAVQQTNELAQDGSNLAQVLHTINSNDRRMFQEIERFVQAALPDVGELQAPLERLP